MHSLRKQITLSTFLAFLAGLFPFWVGIILMADSDFTQISQADNFINHIAWTNLITTGFTTITMALFVLPQKKRQNWIILLILIFWTAGNDFFALYNKFGPSNPMTYLPFCPLTLICTAFGVELWTMKKSKIS